MLQFVPKEYKKIYKDLIKRPLYLVCLLFENLNGVIKDHQKNPVIKTPKIDPIFGIFSEASEFSSK